MRVSNLLAMSLLFVSCSPNVESDSPLPVGEPESVGMTTSGLSRIRPAMQRYVDDGIVSGVVTMVARRGELVHWEAVGYRDIEDQTLLEPNDILRICSMTKPITSVGVMMLLEDGGISLDAPVSQYLPDLARLQVYTSAGVVPPTSPVTIEDLLGHTSGLTYGLFGETPVDSLYRSEDVFSGDLENLVEEVSGLPLLGHPGSLWNYGVSTDILGRVIEVVSGQPLDEFLKDRVLEPLGMTDTDFYVPPEKSPRLASVYVTAADGSLERLEISSCRNGDMPQLLSGGAGLLSTASDYVRFSQMLLNGGELDGTRLLRPETVELMRTNRLPEELIPIRIGANFEAPGYGFGLGFSVLTDADITPVPDTDGVFRWLGAASTYFWIDPGEELIGLVMTQLAPGIHPELETEFQTLVYEAISR